MMLLKMLKRVLRFVGFGAVSPDDIFCRNGSGFGRNRESF